MDWSDSSFPDIGPENISLFYKQEPLFGNLPFLLFYGPSTEGNSTNNSSRIQAHIYSLGGFRSFPRLTVAPTSPLYAAVNHLPLDLQGDDVSRGLAISVLRYFTSLSGYTKDVLRHVARNGSSTGSLPTMFDEMHAAHVAAGMVHILDCKGVMDYLRSAIAPQTISWLDIDIFLPPNSLSTTSTNSATRCSADNDDVIPSVLDIYEPITKALTVLPRSPSSALQRAPSNAPMHNPPDTLSKENKVSLRQEMCEFVDTESNYLDKLRDLVSIAAPEKCTRGIHSVSHNALITMLRDILDVDEPLYRAVQTILDETEDAAVTELQTCSVRDYRTSQVDMTGILPFTTAIAEELPKFKLPYQAYLRAANNINLLLDALLSSVTLNEASGSVGQQQLKSLLIEPVQRLPRCSLFVNSMLQKLPLRHEARPHLLKSRDLLSDICQLSEDRGLETINVLSVLKHKIDQWPQSMNELGNFVTAVDAVELVPPFIANNEGSKSIILLFSKKLVVIRKHVDGSMSGRALIGALRQAEQGKPEQSSSIQHEFSGLSFGFCMSMKLLLATESTASSVVYLREIPASSVLAHEAIQIQTHAFKLQAPYDARSSRLSWEIARSRLDAWTANASPEHRNDHYTASLGGSPTEIGVIASIGQLKHHQSLRSQYEKGLIRLFVDVRPPPSSLLAQAAGSTIVGHLQVRIDKPARLLVENVDGLRIEEDCDLCDAIHRFRTAVQNMLRKGCSGFLECHVAFDALVLQALPLAHGQTGPKRKASRPKSPVKLLSNMLGGLNNVNPNHFKTLSNTLTSNQPVEASPISTQVQTVAVSHKQTGSSPTKSMSEISHARGRAQSSLEQLEDSFLAYVVALRSRSGNVVGRILHARSNADELAINELYNSLLEDPKRLEVASVVPVDVLFSAFEKFLRVAWRERMGPLVAPSMIKILQTAIDNTDAKSFQQIFRQCIDEMSPQNRRAFAATLKLLSDLLDASGNDGDRGVLIASFAEALVLTGNPLESVNLFDRLSEDFDTLFEDYPDANALTTSNSNSPDKERSNNASSISSNASSLRKRLGLSRSDSKAETDSKVAAIWRTLSRNAKPYGENDLNANNAKPLLGRSRSTDTDNRMLPPSRPTSRDRPPTAGSTSTIASCYSSDSPLRSAFVSLRDTETLTKKASSAPRRKRRSSLSDLPSLKSPTNEQDRMVEASLKHKNPAELVPGPAISRPSSNHSDRTRLSPQRSRLPRFNSPVAKNESLNSQSTSSRPSSRDAVVIATKPHSTLMRGLPDPQGSSHRSGLKERSWPPTHANIPPRTSTDAELAEKQVTPQKNQDGSSFGKENSVVSSSTLQAEMTKIGAELSTLNKPHPVPGHTVHQVGRTRLQELSGRLDELQRQLNSQKVKPAALEAGDAAKMTSKLAVSEKRVRQLDELYREANAENEALYERFNNELRKILLRVKKGEGIDLLRSELEASQKDASRLRSENAILKRDIASLKSGQI